MWLVIILAASLLATRNSAQSASVEVAVPSRGESVTVDKIRDLGKLRAGIVVAPPWLWQNPQTSEYVGPAISVGRRLASVLNVELQLLPSSWDAIIAGLQAQHFELALAPLTATERRKAVVDFVNYAVAGNCYAVLKSNGRINEISDLNNPNVVIGTFTGTGKEPLIRAKFPKAQISSIVQAPGGPTRVLEVIAKRIDVAPFDSPLAKVLQDKYREVKILPGDAQQCIQNPDLPIPIGMAFEKNDPTFRGFLQGVVDSMRKEIEGEIVKYSTSEYLSLGKE
jgi:polar amino acid transport system substrate-binding protein